MSKIRVLLLDDKKGPRTAWRTMLVEQADLDLDIVETGTAQQAKTSVAQGCDVAVLDDHVQGEEVGADVCSFIKQRCPRCIVYIVTAYKSRDDYTRAREHTRAANGVFRKSETNELKTALGRAVRAAKLQKQRTYLMKGIKNGQGGKVEIWKPATTTTKDYKITVKLNRQDYGFLFVCYKLSQRHTEKELQGSHPLAVIYENTPGTRPSQLPTNIREAIKRASLKLLNRERADIENWDDVHFNIKNLTTKVHLSGVNPCDKCRPLCAATFIRHGSYWVDAAIDEEFYAPRDSYLERYLKKRMKLDNHDYWQQRQAKLEIVRKLYTETIEPLFA